MRSIRGNGLWQTTFVIGATAATALASPVRLDNPAGPGHFIWKPPASGGNVVLDITRPYDSQTSALTDNGAFRQLWATNSSVVINVNGGTGNRIQGTAVPSGSYSTATNVNYLDILPLPDPPTPFTSTVYVFRSNATGSDPFYAMGEGLERYLSVEFNPGDGIHYGWIGVVRTGNFLDAFAWGYETMPNTPIPAGIPEPSALLLLGVGGLAAARRRG